jgi:hypothetical protein
VHGPAIRFDLVRLRGWSNNDRQPPLGSNCRFSHVGFRETLPDNRRCRGSKCNRARYSCRPPSKRSIVRGFANAIHDQDFDRIFGRLKLETKLVLKCRKERFHGFLRLSVCPCHLAIVRTVQASLVDNRTPVEFWLVTSSRNQKPEGPSSRAQFLRRLQGRWGRIACGRRWRRRVVPAEVRAVWICDRWW